MSLKPLLIIHPIDKTTSFLNRVKNHLFNNFSEITHVFNIHPNDTSHNLCLERIAKHPDNGLIIFLGHGKSDGLYGSKGNKYGDTDLISYEAVNQNNSEYYYKENFIDQKNIDIFKNKKVFCLACNSNSLLANYAIESGATSFVGFGDIPTSLAEFKEKYKDVSGDVVIKMKTELNYIIKTSLKICIEGNMTFNQLTNYIDFISNQRLTDILINQKNLKERYIIANHIFLLKKEMKIFGNNHLKLIE